MLLDPDCCYLLMWLLCLVYLWHLVWGVGSPNVSKVNASSYLMMRIMHTMIIITILIMTMMAITKVKYLVLDFGGNEAVSWSLLPTSPPDIRHSY